MPLWVQDSTKNLFSPQNIDTIKNAAERSLIFGYHYRPHSGAGPNYWICNTFEQFIDYVAAHPKPGDWYGVCSLSALLGKHTEIAQARYPALAEGQQLILSPESIQAVSEYLQREQYIATLTIYCLQAQEDFRMEIDDLSDYADWLELVEDYSRPGAEIYVFPYEVVEEESASLLVEVQYPNERGEVLL